MAWPWHSASSGLLPTPSRLAPRSFCGGCLPQAAEGKGRKVGPKTRSTPAPPFLVSLLRRPAETFLAYISAFRQEMRSSRTRVGYSIDRCYSIGWGSSFCFWPPRLSDHQRSFCDAFRLKERGEDIGTKRALGVLDVRDVRAYTTWTAQTAQCLLRWARRAGASRLKAPELWGRC